MSLKRTAAGEGEAASLAKRPRACRDAQSSGIGTDRDVSLGLEPEDYTIAWICALHLELAASRAIPYDQSIQRRVGLATAIAWPHSCKVASRPSLFRPRLIACFKPPTTTLWEPQTVMAATRRGYNHGAYARRTNPRSTMESLLQAMSY
jgi:hypothetical protein